MFNDAPHRIPLWRTPAVLGLLIALSAACDPADGESAGTDTEPDGDETQDMGEGEARITVTVDDGTVYELTDVTSCATSVTDPSGFPLSNGYDLAGRTADGAFGLTAIRAGLDEENAVFSGAVEGDFDDNGLNSKMVYRFDQNALTLLVDGASVAGTVGSDAVAPTRPHGDHAVFTIDARCE
ncbi:MAG: hypothetical protein KUG77_05730 [Nannocystaceae bacterium]|nr:hypothetical protein [Nannocystaceae bacterium]